MDVDDFKDLRKAIEDYFRVFLVLSSAGPLLVYLRGVDLRQHPEPWVPVFLVGLQALLVIRMWTLQRKLKSTEIIKAMSSHYTSQDLAHPCWTSAVIVSLQGIFIVGGSDHGS